jgi:hypothetical protein
MVAYSTDDVNLTSTDAVRQIGKLMSICDNTGSKIDTELSLLYFCGHTKNLLVANALLNSLIVILSAMEV